MGETQLTASKPELYERLIDRLGLALEVARTSVRLRDEMPAELELRDLSDALAVAITHAHVRATAQRLGVNARQAWSRK